jgi:hypothetical protein
MTLYKTTPTQTIIPTTMLVAKANSPDPGLAIAGMAAEEPLVELAGVEVAVAEPEPDEPVIEAVAVC